MVFRDRTYSVLIVSASEKFNSSIVPLLPYGEFWPLKYTRTSSEARRILLEQDYDIVIINSPLPDELGSRLAADICDNSDSSVMIFVRNDMYEDISFKIMERGAMCIAKPAVRQSVQHDLRLLCATRERMARIEKKQTSIEKRMEEIRLINKAKWKLIDQGMTENEAHKYIERRAMDLRVTRAVIAEEILCS